MTRSLFLVLVGLFSFSNSFAGSCETAIGKAVADDYLAKFKVSLQIDSVTKTGSVRAGEKRSAYGSSCLFKDAGDLYEVVDNYMGGTGISLVTAGTDCKAIQICTVYSE